MIDDTDNQRAVLASFPGTVTEITHSPESNTYTVTVDNEELGTNSQYSGLKTVLVELNDDVESEQKLGDF